MVVFTQFTALAAGLSTIASAVPIVRPPTVNPRRAFSVGQVSKPLSKEKEINLDGVYANTLVKYGAQVPDNVKAAAERGSAIAKPQQHDMAYLTPVKVGESTLNLDIDTGSADL
jgi:aspergillopepsin I